MVKPTLSDFNFDSNRLSRYELEIGGGVTRIKSNGPDDHARLMEALAAVQSATVPVAALQSREVAPTPAYGLTFTEVLDKFLALRPLKPGSIIAVKNAVKEFVEFFGSKCHVSQILVSDITRFQEKLRAKGNTPRTIDGKVSYLKSVLNFAIKQGLLIGKNPCESMSLMTKKQKLTGGYAIFETNEIQQLVHGDYFKSQKLKDPDYYWTVVLALLTGCRVSELTSMEFDQVQKTPKGNDILVIRESKTAAGRREVPVPTEIFDAGFADFIQGKLQLFKYAPLPGKGSGNAAGKKFARHLELENITREKLVFHSLRKYANNFFQKNGVEFEPRCQFFGHEVEAVNVATYTNKYNSDELHRLVNPSQMVIWKMIQS